jgi:hypothetical protein
MEPAICRRVRETHPDGQQAGLLLASSAQVWPFTQHMPLKAEPRLEQLKVLAMQPDDCRFTSGRAVSAGRKGC